jgi:hypothetical protein
VGISTLRRISCQEEVRSFSIFALAEILKSLHSPAAMSKQVIVTGPGGLEEIYCKGARRGQIGAPVGKRRAAKAARWILEHAVGRVSGPSEQRLRDWLRGSRDDVLPMQLIHEFNHLVG